MKLLLINPPVRRIPEWFPLGLGYIASSLLEEGHKLEVLDLNANRLSEEETEKKLQNLKHDAVLVSGCLITLYKYIKWLTSIIKENNKDIPLVVGGNVVTPIPKLFLEKTKTDIAVIGEGEITAKELINALEKNKDLSKVNGIAYRKKGKVKITKPRPLIKDLDSLSFPAYDLFEMDAYIKNPGGVSKFINKMDMISTRGCPFRCNFCYRNFGKVIRFRSIKNLIEEIKLLKEKYKIKTLSFLDEHFLTNRKRAIEFCERMVKEKLDLEWNCNGRVNSVDLALLQNMKKAGCVNMGFGIESGSQKILDIIHKETTVEQAKNALCLTKKAGITAGGSFMIGMIGETKETVQKTIEFCKDADTKLGHKLFFATPLPGTELYEDAKKMNKIKDEEKYILSLGEMTDTLLVNLTEMSDEELISLKKRTEYIIKRSYMLNHPIETLKKQLLITWNYYKYHGGFKSLLKRGLEKALKKDNYVKRAEI